MNTDWIHEIVEGENFHLDGLNLDVSVDSVYEDLEDFQANSSAP